MRARGIARLAVVVACLATAHAQLAVPAEVDLFGDEIVQKVKSRTNGLVFPNIGTATAQKSKTGPAGYGHLLLFHDGRQVRGTLHALTKEEVLWRRPDATEPLRIARGEVRRILLTPPDTDASGISFDLAVARATMSTRTGNGNTRATPATVKLPGCDWLHGDVISADGRTFEFRLRSGGKLNLPRERIEWLYFDDLPAPAVGFPGSALAMEEWLPRNATTKIEIANGTLTAQSPAWLGRKLPAQLPARFEVAFEVPKDAEEGTRLVLQPGVARTNLYTRGTVDLRFGPTELARCIYSRKVERETTPVPDAPTAPGAPVSYRVLYDGVGERLSVIRNGALIGQWVLIEEDDRAAARSYALRISAICLERENRGESRPLKLHRLRVLPWDGAMPKPGETAPTRDVFSGFKEEPIEGTLEVLADNGLIFSEATKMRRAGVFVRFPHQPAPLADADAHLLFGAQGEFAVAGLEVRDDQARCRTSFADSFELPTTTLETITFARRNVDAPPPADVLVFKNGDELRGTLLTAAPEKPLRWRMPCGQEIDLYAARTAGVRLGVGREAKPADDAATVELRNGDRLRGEVAAFDAEKLLFRHERLGAVSLARDRLWLLHPARSALPLDSGRDAQVWLKGPALRESKTLFSGEASPEAGSWICIDGQYICRGVAQSSFYRNNGGIGRTLPGVGDRFELRFDLTDFRGRLPGCSIQLTGADDDDRLLLTDSYGSWYLSALGANLNNRMPPRRIQVSDQVKDRTSRASMRVFVDRKAGTAAFFLDGVLLAKMGQQASERIAGLGKTVCVGGASYGSPSVISQLAILPWNGDLPGKGGDAGPRTVLVNGDTVPEIPKELREGKFIVESEIGPLEAPVEKVQTIEFGGEFSPARTAARVRLADGGVLHVDGFRWDGRELTAHSAMLGDVRIPAAELSELILDPAPLREPQQAMKRKE